MQIVRILPQLYLKTCSSSILFALRRYLYKSLHRQIYIMKKLLLPTLLMLAAWGNAQSIDVSTTSHTVPQLVNNVLINSPCVEATNVTWRTGTNYGSVNGI